MDDAKFVGCGALVTLAFLFALVFATVDASYSKGSRVGHVVKLSEKGLVCKTTEGELILDGAAVIKTEHGTSGVWEFTVKDPAIAKQIEDAMKRGDRVELQYNQLWHTSACWGSTSYSVVGVVVGTPEKKLP